MADKTSYLQCLTHMIKGNLGAGILAMPASFAHTGLVGAILGLPFLCLVSAYCVHLLVSSAQKIELKSKGQKFNQNEVNYAKLTRGAFELGPERTRGLACFMSRAVDTCLLVTQIGVCCVYIIFVVDNIASILASYSITVPKSMIFLAILPVALMLSFIKTLARLTVASLIANLLQTVGLALIVEYLLRDIDKVALDERDKFRPISEMALGFGSAMFAFEGISVVLPLYARMRRPKSMTTCSGVINISFFVILILYFIMGLLGYLKFGHRVRDSITLNLPATPLYDAVRAMFTASILLSYPLQFYVPNEIIWNWARKNLIKPSILRCNNSQIVKSSMLVVAPGTKITQTIDEPQQGGGDQADATDAVIGTASKSTHPNCDIEIACNSKLANQLAKFTDTSTDNIATGRKSTSPVIQDSSKREPVADRYEYLCRLCIVLLTFTLAMSVPKLNLLMDFIGSFSGAALCLTIPATLHLASFWDDTRGFYKVCLILVDGFIIIASICAGLGGSLSSLISIIRSFHL